MSDPTNMPINYIGYQTESDPPPPGGGDSTGFSFQRFTPSDLAQELLYRPLCYFIRDLNRVEYDLYVSLVVHANETISVDTDPQIQLTGATYFVSIVLSSDGSKDPGDEKKVIYLVFRNVPKPEGFKVASLTFEVRHSLPTGDGLKTTTVDYSDADEEVPIFASHN